MILTPFTQSRTLQLMSEEGYDGYAARAQAAREWQQAWANMAAAIGRWVRQVGEVAAAVGEAIGLMVARFRCSFPRFVVNLPSPRRVDLARRRRVATLMRMVARRAERRRRHQARYLLT